MNLKSFKVGVRRKFNAYPNKDFEIREILDAPQISMWWTWTTGICPHCKEQIKREIKHDLNRIEILGLDGKSNNDLTRDDIVLLGFSMDNRTMFLSIDKYDEVFLKSKDFKHLKEVI